MAVSLLAKLWTCDQQNILYIVFTRYSMSIYCVLGGFVGTYSEDEQDYRLFCPDERYQLFHDASTDLARSIKQMNSPTQYKRGKAASMRREMSAMAKAITNLSPETEKVIKDREVDFINRAWGNCDELINPHINDGARDFQRMSIWLDIDHSLKRLRDPIEELREWIDEFSGSDVITLEECIKLTTEAARELGYTKIEHNAGAFGRRIWKTLDSLKPNDPNGFRLTVHDKRLECRAIRNHRRWRTAAARRRNDRFLEELEKLSTAHALRNSVINH